MTKQTKLIAIILGTIMIGTSAYAARGEAGSSNDPLVTKSYVDQKLDTQSQMVDLLMKEVNSLKSQGSSQYQVVEVAAGQMITGVQGTEIIVRSGEAQVVASNGGGLQDMTDGVDLAEGTMVPKYHLVIIPREDGRGLFATKDIIVMVRGGYNIH